MLKSVLKPMMLLLIVIFMVGGCGSKKEPTPAPAPTDAVVEPNQDNGDRTNTDPNWNMNQQWEAASETVTGTYVGQIDNSSVEIEVDGYPQPTKARAFQLSDNLKNRWDSISIKEGDKVTIRFANRDEQTPILLEISK